MYKGYGLLSGVDQVYGDRDHKGEEPGDRVTMNVEQRCENEHEEARIVKPLVLAAPHIAIEGTMYARQGSDDSTANGPK